MNDRRHLEKELAQRFSPLSAPQDHLIEALEKWGKEIPTDIAFYFLVDGENEEQKITYAELLEEVQALAGELLEHAQPGDRVLLLYGPGLEFVIGFFATLYAGMVAVPAFPPRRNRNTARVDSIADDAKAKLALTTSEVFERAEPHIEPDSTLDKIKWIQTDQPLAGKPQRTSLVGGPEELAVLQYTSGSTGTPKGVMLTHANLIRNTEFITYAFEPTRAGSGMTWLPTYHDMGLVGGVLNPLYYGRPNVLMSPMAFLQKPIRWLRAISKYRVSISGGPNFAYELCNEKITPDECEGLDLSSWEVAFNGAEPVRAATLQKFTEKFAPYGFQAHAHYPCYGMAETTLIVTGGYQPEEPPMHRFAGSVIDSHRVEIAADDDDDPRLLVGCGRVLPGETIKIVDPETRQVLPPDEIGEIWIKGPSVGAGYWNRSEETQETFGAKLADGSGPFLRTGDLGYMYDEELYVTGRIKDLIIVRGVNRYPQDIEATAEAANEHMRKGGCAAFAADFAGRERLIIVAETERGRDVDWNSVINDVRSAVSAQHEVPPDAVCLVRTGAIPKTSSGKVQRHACRQAFIDGDLRPIGEWVSWQRHDDPVVLPFANAEGNGTARKSAGKSDKGSAMNQESPGRDAILEVVYQHVQRIGKERTKNLTPDSNVVEAGLDSLERMEIAANLEEEFGGRFPEEVLAEIETCNEIAAAIEDHILAAEAGVKEIPESYYKFDSMPEVQRLQAQKAMADAVGAHNPYFNVHESVCRDTTIIGGKEMINWSSYNYVGMSGDPILNEAAKEQIDQFGTSTSASRLVSGQKTIHVDLEKTLADFLGVEETLTFVSGYSTNSTTIGHLFGPGDLVIHDALAHNSIIKGCELSGARRRPFPHNDLDDLDATLADVRGQYRKVLIAVEGVYSMDGDYPDLPRLLEIKDRHKALLYLDEAHSITSMGKTGRGLTEHFGVDASRVDILMGVLSKGLGSSGGFIGGSKSLIEYLRYTAPGFVFTGGLCPSAAGAALAAVKLLEAEPQRVEKCRSNADLFRKLAKEAGMNIGYSNGTPVVPIITGDSWLAVKLSEAMMHRGVNVQPIMHPAVEDHLARLRFFISSLHSHDQVRKTIAHLKAAWAELTSEKAAMNRQDRPQHAV